MSDEEPVLICMSVAELQTPSPDAQVKLCGECGVEIWVSASGLIAAGGDPKLACTRCMMDIGEEDAEFGEVTEGQMKIILQAMPELTEEDVRADLKGITERFYLYQKLKGLIDAAGNKGTPDVGPADQN